MYVQAKQELTTTPSYSKLVITVDDGCDCSKLEWSAPTPLKVIANPLPLQSPYSTLDQTSWYSLNKPIPIKTGAAVSMCYVKGVKDCSETGEFVDV